MGGSAGQVTFGMGLFTGQHPNGGPPLYRQALDLARATEAAGIDVFWVSEHHGLPDGYLPAPLTLLAGVASVTERLRLGAGLLVAPLYHPVRLAEEAAVLDQLSDGRLLLGLGWGYAAHEYATFGVPASGRGARLTDLVSFLRTAWRGEPFDWDGPAYHGRRVLVSPRPVRGPAFPLWLGGYAAAAVHRAGRIADGYLVGRGDRNVLTQTLAELATVRKPQDGSFTVGVNLLVSLNGTPAETDRARAGFHHQQLVYEQIQRGRDVFAGRVGPATPGRLDVGRYFQAAGDVDEVVAQVTAALTPLREWASVHVVLRALFPETDLASQLRRIRRLGEQVIPQVRAALS